MTPTCPVCGTPLRVYGRGATARKHSRYACPAAEREGVWASHDGYWVWDADDPALHPDAFAEPVAVAADDDLPF